MCVLLFVEIIDFSIDSFTVSVYDDNFGPKIDDAIGVANWVKLCKSCVCVKGFSRWFVKVSEAVNNDANLFYIDSNYRIIIIIVYLDNIQPFLESPVLNHSLLN